jgi:membrane protein YqaA with SNARE-associated domain
MIKRLYNWVLSWSESRWGWVALLFIALFEASWFPLPPDILLIALCLGATAKSFRFATICLIGSVVGAALGYGIGHFLWITPDGDPTALASLFYEYVFSIEKFQNVGSLYDRFNFWIIFTAGFTPLPFKLFTIAGGMFDINFVMFIIASIIARGMRFFLIAGLIWKFGAPIKVFIDKYFNLLASLFAVLLIGFTALAFWLFGSAEDPQNNNTVTTNTEQVEEIELTSNSNSEQCDTLDL